MPAWENAPIIDGPSTKTKKPAWEAAPIIQEPAGAVGRAPPAAGAEVAATPDQAPSAPITGVDTQSAFERMRLGRSPSEAIDYKTGAPLDVRIGLFRAANPKEAELFLGKHYPPGKFGQTPEGDWWVEQGGRRTAVMPSGISGFFGNLGAGLSAGGPETTGAIVGGLAASPLGPLPAAAGAAAGAAVGHGLEQLYKWAEGLYAQKPKEAIGGALQEAALAGAGNLVGPAARATGRGIRAGLRWATESTIPATREISKTLMEAGVTPPIKAYAPGAAGLSWKQSLRNIIHGVDPQEAKRVAFMDQRVRSIFSSIGVPHSEIDAIISKVHDKSALPSATEAGEALTTAARSVQEGLVKSFSQARGEAEAMLAATTNKLKDLAKAAPTTAGDTASGIWGVKNDFNMRMGRLYSRVDKMAGETPAVSTQGLTNKAIELEEKWGADVPFAIRKWIDGGVQGEAMTFEQAHAMRTVFRHAADVDSFNGGSFKTHMYKEMADAMHDAMQTPLTQLGERAAKALRVADDIYKKGIVKFDNAIIQSLVKDAKSGLLPEPSLTAAHAMQPEHINVAKELKRWLPEETWNNVVKADLGNILQGATDFQGKMSGEKLLEILNKRGKLMDATYPPELLDQLRRHAKELALFDAKVPNFPTMGPPTEVVQKLEEAAIRARDIEQFVKNNPLGALASGSPQTVDAAVSALTKPGAERQLEETVATIARNSSKGMDDEAIRALRKNVFVNVFNAASEQRPSGIATISGKKLMGELGARFTDRQLKLLFPNTAAEDVKLLAKQAMMLFPSDYADMSGKLAGGAIKKGLWTRGKAVWDFARYTAVGYIADHPKLMNFLVGEIKKDPYKGRSLLGVTLQSLGRIPLREGPGGGSPEPETEKPSYGGTGE